MYKGDETMKGVDNISNHDLAYVGFMYASKLLGLKGLELIFEDESAFKETYVHSKYIKEAYIVSLKEQWVEKATKSSILATVFHEVRHAYQNAQIEFPQAFKFKESSETLSTWKYEFEHYQAASETGGLEESIEYSKQAVEIDAVAFELVLLEHLFGYKINPHESIKTEVEARKKVLEKQYKTQLNNLK